MKKKVLLVDDDDSMSDYMALVLKDEFEIEQAFDGIEGLEKVDEFKPETFESELNAWFCDPDLWPEDRSIGAIDKWLRIELHSMLIDLERGRLKKREW